MENKHNNIKRIVHRAMEEINSTVKVSCETSMTNFTKMIAAKKLNYKLNKEGRNESKKDTYCLLYKHDILMQYFEKRYGDFAKTYIFDEKSIPEKSSFRDKIWVCWWQGIEQAPDIVKRCVQSIRINAAPYEVVVLDDTNYRNYVNIPDWMERKRNQGIITRTHFSDFLRLELLAEHGGIWLDSTFFASKFNAKEIIDLPVWSIKRPDYGHLSVACGRFANYSFGCNFENRKAFAIIRDYLLEYWKTNDSMIDYLFLDYLIELALRHNDYLKKMFDQIPDNNPECDELQKCLGKKGDEELWIKISKNTHLFKLSWKQEYPSNIDGADTFYGKIINESI